VPLRGTTVRRKPAVLVQCHRDVDPAAALEAAIFEVGRRQRRCGFAVGVDVVTGLLQPTSHCCFFNALGRAIR
jgi:hypothetical protein